MANPDGFHRTQQVTLYNENKINGNKFITYILPSLMSLS